MKKSITFLLGFTLIMLLHINTVEATSGEYFHIYQESFDSVEEITEIFDMTGDASFNANPWANQNGFYTGGAISLNNAAPGSTGTITTKDEVYLDGGFYLQFSFTLPNKDANGADALSFVMFDDAGTELTVRFDTYQNPGDASSSSLQVFKDDMMMLNHDLGETYFSGDKIYEAQIKYHAFNGYLYLKLNDEIGETTTTANVPVDLSDFMQDYVNFSFTAYTGASYENHDIHSMYFANRYLLDEYFDPTTDENTQDNDAPVLNSVTYTEDTINVVYDDACGHEVYMRYSTGGSFSQWNDISSIPFDPSLNYTIESYAVDDCGNTSTVETSYVDELTVTFMNGGNEEDVDYTLNSTSGFQRDIIYSGSASKIAPVDLDNDGDLDVVSTYGSTMLYHENLGDGTYAAAVTLQDNSSTTVSFYDVDVADFNEDGHMDIVASDVSNKNVYLFTNNGSGWFDDVAPGVKFTTISTTSEYYESIFILDYNEDDNVDVVISSKIGEIILFTGNGDGTFTETSFNSYIWWVNSLIATDIDGDSDIDFFAAGGNGPYPTFHSAVAWYENTGTGYTEHIITHDYSKAVANVIDYDADGDLDVIVGSKANSPATVDVLLNDGSQNFAYSETLLSQTTAYIQDIQVLDFNGSGTDQIAFFDSQSDVLYLSDDMSANSATLSTLLNYTNMSAIQFVMNDDGAYDIYSTISYNTINHIKNTVEYKLEDPNVTPTKTGYTFEGWCETENCTELFNFNTVLTEDLVLYAKYNVNEYSITFEDADGNVLQTNSYDYAVEITNLVAPDAPVIEGYSFTGWDIEIPEYMPANDVTLTAEYEIEQYTLTFVTNEGGVLYEETFDFGADLASVVAPNAPDVIGSTFTGWDQTIPATMPASDTVITTVYTQIQYVLEYVDYDGTVLQTATFTYNEDLSAVTAPVVPDREGYTNTGWDNTLASTMPTNNITITAVYDINSYVITYDNNGVITTEEVDYGSTLTEVPTPYKENFEFVEWQLNGNTFEPSTYVQGIDEHTIVAVFIDAEAPVISGVSDALILLSEVNEFEVQTPTVTDAVDGIILEYTYQCLKADGVTEIDLESMMTELQNGRSVVIKYNSADSSMNNALEVVVTISVTDDVAPIVSNIQQEQIFEKGSEVEIDFNEGTATLNDEEVLSGTIVTEKGEYILIVTDEAGNSTTVEFEIEGSSYWWIIVVTGGGSLTAAGYIFRKTLFSFLG